MPIFETPNGTRMELMLPGGVPWPELKKAVDEYKTRLRERRAAGQRLGATARQQEQAIRKDLDALKEALIAGKPDPGPVHEEKAKKEAEAAKRRYDALDLAIEDAELKLIEIIDAHREEWVAEMEAKEEHARGDFELAIEDLRLRRTQLALRRAIKYWLTNFPDHPTFRFGVGPVRQLTAPHGDPYNFEQVIDALRFEAAPPKNAEPPAVIPLPRENVQAS